ncbi:MAG: hypothetical protein NC416_18205 [Eubacterium sp.]|nr:hypothetical protein [Eubacterium sp.]
MNLRYFNEKINYEVEFVFINNNVVQLTGRFPIKQKGFVLYRDGAEDDLWDYSGYTTVYREIEGGAQFSNDGSIYSVTVNFVAGSGGSLEGTDIQSADKYENLIIPTPIPVENYEFVGWHPEIPDTGTICENRTFTANFAYVETLEEIKEAKVSEMNAAQQEIITTGIDVTLSDGTTDHFDLTDRDQMRIMGLQKLVEAGEQMISWHTSDESEHCKFYKNEDMALITEKAMAYVTWHVTYFRDLRIYIRSLETKEEVAAVTYGMIIPEKYQSDPLKAMILTMVEE